MRGRKKMERSAVKFRTLYTRLRQEDAKNLDIACIKENKTYAEFIRDAVLEKLERMGQ